ncbi:4895_t:CDS:2 [Funneliformis geosporum]|uniref:10924_t:CDS:1 n=1 Tax=Funneliformis geosporum TaxID=1117311 RepID=A0A9W4SP94_9GLOM|nr:4895_t:CDS:2 [Funneliformis geosporum]CAI2175505.1 10924_t:CDS:2 [Funneliformis geosporum]
MESSKNIIGQDAQAKKLSLSRSKSTSNKVKNNKPSSIVTSNLSNISKSKVDKPKSPTSSKDASSSRNVERKKSISGTPSTIGPLNKNKSVQTTTTRKQKVGTISSNVSASDGSSPDNLLDRRPSAPPKLNLAFKNHRIVAASQQISPNDSSSKNSLGKVSPSVATPPSLMSPKIRELRKSEPFQSKPSGKDTSDDDTSSSRRVPAKTHVKKKTSALSSLPKAELNKELLARLEHQNSQLPPQDSTQFLLARLERQNEMLDNDPKSVCIESNVLKANMEVVQSLIDDITSPITDASGPEDLSSSLSVMEHRDLNDEETKKIDWDFWTALIQDYAAVATKLPHLLSAKLQQGLPMKLRGLIWQSMSQASSTYLETMYSQLLLESSPYDRIIQRDLARTFPTVEMFKEENGRGQTMLWNVLKAYSLYDPLVGYCQGLGFLVGPLLMNMSEAQAFCVFVRLMETYDMRTMFTLNMEGLQLRLYQFSCLLSQIIPSLHSHFRLHGIHEAMFASQWFLSLFAYTYPLPLVFRIYDVVFAEGAPETIMRVAIALLKKNEEKLLELGEFEELLDFLTTKLYDTYNNEPTSLIQDAMELSSVITKSKLDQLSENYVNDIEDQKKRTEELVAVRFNVRSSSTSSDISTSSDNEAPIPKTPLTPSFFSSSTSIGVLHQQIEDLVTALSHLQKEHADVTGQLVTIKMEKMDLVNEVEGLNNQLRGLEKENKRASTSSLISVDSAMTLSNDEGFESGRTTRIASPITPNPDQKSGYDHVKNLVHYIGSKFDISDNEILKMRRSSAPATSLTESQLSLILNNNNASDSTGVSSKDKSFGLVEEWNDESKKQYSLELALTEELIQVKREKFDLMLENRELVKRNSELENALENSHQIQKSLKDKNSFLSKEIERLDEEVAQALYEKNSMREEIKAVKPLRIEHIRANRENEKLKLELENVETRLRQYEPEYIGNNDWVITMEEIDEILSATTPKSSRRVSFLNFFGAITPTGSNGGFIFPTCTIESCTSTKKCDDLEKMLKHVKMLLVESEAARGQLSSHIDELNSMINGFDNLYDDDIFQSVGETENSFQKKPKSEKRLSTSLAAFFGAA